MREAGRQARAGVVIAAGGLLAAACAVQQPAGTSPGADLDVPGGAHYARVPTSLLVSRRDLPFKLAQLQRGDQQVTLLVHQPDRGEASPVAAISTSQSEPLVSVSLPRPSPGTDADLRVATLEHLYSLALRQDPEARFCLLEGLQHCNAASQGRSHGELLRELVRAREQAVARAQPGSMPMLPWRVVAMMPAPATVGDDDEVGVRVLGDQGPMEGATVYFNRAPHSSCVAKSGANGLAACHLVDQHGDDGAHSEHDGAAVVATYPGSVRTDLILVPTTIVVRRGPAG